MGESDGYLISADRNPNTTGAKLILGLNDPGSRLEDIKNAITKDEVKALIVLQENLIDDADFSAEDFSSLEFLMTTYPMANPTAEVADVVLPGACWAEKSGTMINVTGRLQRLNQAVDPPGQTMQPWEIIRDLIQNTGGGNGIYSTQDLFNLLTSEVSDFVGVTWDQIGDLGMQLIDTGETIPLLEKERQKIAKGIIVG